jgi:LAGLIDADG DNA endonuclease family protein
MENNNNLYNLTHYQIQVLIGLMLSDGHISKRGNSKNSYFTIAFSIKFKEFALLIKNIFILFITSKGFYNSFIQSGIDSPFYERITLRTLTLPCFTIFHNIFYRLNESTNKYYKIIPLNIEEILTPIVIAFLIMGDGSYNKSRKVIRISTNSYNKIEVELLKTAFENKFNILCSLERAKKDSNQYLLVIRRSQVHKIQDLIKDIVIPSMAYKIGL